MDGEWSDYSWSGNEVERASGRLTARLRSGLGRRAVWSGVRGRWREMVEEKWGIPPPLPCLHPKPLTRTSTRTGSDESAPLATPYDDLPLPGGKAAGRQSYAHDDVQIRAPSSSSSHREPVRIWPSQDADDGAYFARPPGPRQARQIAPSSAPGAALGRRGTTKDLIGRFESMEDAPGVRRSRAGAGATDGGGERERTVTKDKGRSPIRQSFRNLMSVFKKSKPAQRSETPATPSSSLALPGTRYREGSPSSAATPSPSPHASTSPTKPSLTLQIPSLAQTDPRNCASPVSAHTGKQGTLLYLAHTPSSGAASVPPVWLACAAQLHTTHILVSWGTQGGNPASRLVPFGACTDVRSLAHSELAEEERALLPTRGVGTRAELKVFELLFEGRAREKFAAEGVPERASWVSAIWDAVLLAQENRVRSPAPSEHTYKSLMVPAPKPTAAPEPHIHSPKPSKCESPATVSRLSQASTSSANRALPALPPDPVTATERPVLPRLNLRDLPPVQVRQLSLPSGLSPLPAPPVTPTSIRGSSAFLSTPDSPSRTQSPSIRNLDQRSVVKQRLAQIQHAAAETRAASSSPISPSTRRWELRDSPRMLRMESRTGSAAASILNSYADAYPRTEVESPRSMFSGGLTTRPPSLEGSPPPRISAEETRGAASQIRSALEGLAEPLPQSFKSPTPPPQSLQDAPLDSGNKTSLDVIREGVEGLRGRSVTDSTNIVNVRTNVDEVLTEVRRLRSAEGGTGALVTAKLDEVQVDIKGDLSRLQGLMENLKNAGTTPDVAELHGKLDGLLRLCQNKNGETGETLAATTELAEVVTLLKDAEEQRVTQMEQQTDSIRYLNQLNTWLEAFVNHGTSQIEGVAVGVQQLCQTLGPVSELQDIPQDGEAPPGNLLSDIRRLLVQHQERDEHTATLHTSVNGLVAAVQEDMRRNAEARNQITTESVTGMIDRQRMDQERMLKSMATELTNEIRGERLRFVEAMQEATAINVQTHVEEFKKELTREVMLMTQEVTRLQRERQGLEQQIADLFAFYAKQQQAGKIIDGGRMPGAVQAMLAPQQPIALKPGDILPSQTMYRRPLPSPAPSPTRYR
ncbi:hypothetical protein VTO73DRAFT_6565 [Trametes versicolor]